MKLGLCEGRHKMPVKKYIFPKYVPVFNSVYMRRTIESKIPKGTYKVILYVTGLTTAILEVVKYCIDNNISLTAMHYDKDSNDWIAQEIC